MSCMQIAKQTAIYSKYRTNYKLFIQNFLIIWFSIDVQIKLFCVQFEMETVWKIINIHIHTVGKNVGYIFKKIGFIENILMTL